MEQDKTSQARRSADHIIRKYALTDWASICEIYDQSKPYELAAGGVLPSFVRLSQDKERQDELRRSAVYVCECTGRIAGFVSCYKSGINFLFVAPWAMGKGIGTALILKGIGEIEGDVHLWAMEGNRDAIKMYRKLGFCVVERINTHNRGAPTRAVKMVYKRSHC